MEQIYFQLILAGRKTIEDVPEQLRLMVQDLLDKNENSVV
ncbi:CD1375 family protein [Heyndrickxia camelliae]|nr:CD1375 family protein [Heyndrickxia camelliae]